MTKKKLRRVSSAPSSFDQARDELFSHILRCGVIEALPEHQKDWLDDTMQYIADRYNDLGQDELTKVRELGERFCRPVVRRTESETDASAETETDVPAGALADAPADAPATEEAETEEVVESASA